MEYLMSIKGEKDHRVRIGLNVSQEMNDVLEELMDSLGTTSKAEVVRRAVALLHVANKAHKEGKHIGIAGQDRKIEVELYGI